MEKYYSQALKQGKSFYKRNVSNGQYPYLPVLDEMLPKEKVDMGKDLGLVQIPTHLIVGTKTRGRTSIFAGNFMPLAEEKSEFSFKWENLCQSHINEGIREPIQAWEFMNRYYVQEGNKRVSVLKFFGAASVYGYVKRIMPDRTGDPQVELYYEFLDFQKMSGINNLEFTKPGSYKEFQKLVGKQPKEHWTEAEKKKFNTNYYYFEKIYNICGGAQLKATVGDALLAYIRVYGYSHLSSQGEASLQKSLMKIWKEITLQQEEKLIEIMLDPIEERKSIIPNLFTFSKKKVAFIYRESIEVSGWRKNHEKGRLYAQRALNDKIETTNYIAANYASVEETMRQAVKDGNTIIFVTGATMLDDSLKVASDYPSVKFFNCSLNRPHKLVQMYYPRMYEGKFITGAIAGALTKHDKIGYICKYPIFGIIAEINAFARGVKLVNPNAKVYLEWSSVDGVEGAVQKLLDQDIHLISFREYGNEVEDKYRMFGLAHVTKDNIYPVALPIWSWGAYYEKILQSVLDGSLNEESEKTNKSLNYYWGISAGVIDIMYAERLPVGIRYLGEVLFKSIRENICQPFYLPNPSPNGTYQWNEANTSISVEDIIKMDYLEENVVGEIPKFTRLEKQAQDLVNNVGVVSARKESEE
ncbi:MAG: BMP family ABC transporter substrate-binding protein [Firmicutes bacterium]|nr:BMP family ABC transporter substrate-binding protein [Bacillota bacterium]